MTFCCGSPEVPRLGAEGPRGALPDIRVGERLLQVCGQQLHPGRGRLCHIPAEYVSDRMKTVDIPKGCANEEPAPRELFHDNRTAVGCLSWVAKETRPDLAFAANTAQARQNHPTIGDVKATNAAIKQAREAHRVPRRGVGQRRPRGV